MTTHEFDEECECDDCMIQWPCECGRKGFDHSCAARCPWGWCDGEDALHDLLCLPSKCAYGISWAHTLSPKELIEEFGFEDIWTRDVEGNITGLKEEQ